MDEGRVGVGSTHHFAFAIETAEELAAWRDYLRGHGVECSEVFDRGGFRSIYFRDPDGHILEIATRGLRARPAGSRRPAPAASLAAGPVLVRARHPRAWRLRSVALGRAVRAPCTAEHVAERMTLALRHRARPSCLGHRHPARKLRHRV